MNCFIRAVLPLMVTLCFFSCNNGVQENTHAQGRVRASVISTGSGNVRCSVVVEGPGGDSLSGAVVSVMDVGNKISSLTYDPSVCAYQVVLEEQAGTTYTFEINTILSETSITIDVPYTAVLTKPNITIFQDEEGDSVLNGQSLKNNLASQIAWSSCGDGVIYQISIKTALTIVYMVSTNANTYTFPAGSIPAGNYAVEVMAQKIYGDPLYKTKNYYSVSTTAGMVLSFNVNN
jgi:hypothetical protein